MSSHHNNLTGEFYAKFAHKITFYAYLFAACLDFTAVLFSLLVAGFILFFHNNATGGLIYLFAAFGSGVCFFIKIVMTFWHKHSEKEHARHEQFLRTQS